MDFGGFEVSFGTPISLATVALTEVHRTFPMR